MHHKNHILQRYQRPAQDAKIFKQGDMKNDCESVLFISESNGLLQLTLIIINMKPDVCICSYLNLKLLTGRSFLNSIKP